MTVFCLFWEPDQYPLFQGCYSTKELALAALENRKEELRLEGISSARLTLWVRQADLDSRYLTL